VQEGRPDTFIVASDLKNKNVAKKHQKFKKGVNMFCLDVLQRLVFSEGIQADKEVIKTLMSFIVTKELPRTRSRDAPRKSAFEGHCINYTLASSVGRASTTPPTSGCPSGNCSSATR
jgi:hypothetical protein